MKNFVLLFFMTCIINIYGQTYQRTLVRQELKYPDLANHFRKGIKKYQTDSKKKVTYCILQVDEEDEDHRIPFICEIHVDTDTIEFDDGYKYYMEIDSIPFLIAEGQDFFNTCKEQKTFTFKQTKFIDYRLPIIFFYVKKGQNPVERKHIMQKSSEP